MATESTGIERLSFSYPKEMKVELQVIAKKESRSVSSLIKIMIDEGLAKRKMEADKAKKSILIKR